MYSNVRKQNFFLFLSLSFPFNLLTERKREKMKKCFFSSSSRKMSLSLPFSSVDFINVCDSWLRKKDSVSSLSLSLVSFSLSLSSGQFFSLQFTGHKKVNAKEMRMIRFRNLGWREDEWEDERKRRREREREDDDDDCLPPFQWVVVCMQRRHEVMRRRREKRNDDDGKKERLERKKERGRKKEEGGREGERERKKRERRRSKVWKIWNCAVWSYVYGSHSERILSLSHSLSLSLKCNSEARGSYEGRMWLWWHKENGKEWERGRGRERKEGGRRRRSEVIGQVMTRWNIQKQEKYCALSLSLLLSFSFILFLSFFFFHSFSFILFLSFFFFHSFSF